VTIRDAWLSIIGIGEDGWDGLSRGARNALESSDVIFGGSRHIALLPGTAAKRVVWKSPISESVDDLLQQYRRRSKVSVLASGDPLLHGIGSVLTQRLHPSEYLVIPQISAFSLACARLGWPIAETSLISLVNSSIETVTRYLVPAARLVVYSRDQSTPGSVIRLLMERGYGRSQVSVFERLGGPAEMRRDGIASALTTSDCDALNVIAITCVADAGIRALPLIPGLPDDAFETDGQMTKREVRAITLAKLAPLPGQLLWDVGAGTGTIGIEWMRVHSSCRCVSFEARRDRADRIAANAKLLGVPGLRVIAGSAPKAFDDEESPDSIFIGGGVSVPGLLEACWGRLPAGGRLVANAVTVSGEMILASWQAAKGGELSRISVSRAEEIGGVLTWRPLSPITQLAATKS
jgi:precorrin-6B C5,15-methyltransferase / cobalt-precorrin-6B C5,C15-methyltransferase